MVDCNARYVGFCGVNTGETGELGEEVEEETGEEGLGLLLLVAMGC
jgi:hypothetical protein